MPNFLVTGSEGQLGKCFQAVTQEFPEHQLIFANRKTLDLTRSGALQKFNEIHSFEGIINCAAYTQVDKAENETDKVNKINANGLQNLISFVEEKELSLIHFSTDYVFDGTASFPYQEGDKPNPINIYGQSKHYGEQLLEKSNCRHTIFRISWLFSPFKENFVKTILKLIKAKENIKVVNDQHGRPTYGIDLARGVLSNISKPDLFNYNCYHYAMQGATTWFDLASKIKTLKKSPCEIKPCSTAEYPTLAKRPKQSILDTRLIENHLSLSISSWENALERCLTRIKVNEHL